MSQTQNQTQNEKKEVELKYGTWGSFGQYFNHIAILRNGHVVDVRELTRSLRLRRGDTVETTIGGVKVTVEDRSSRKNYHIYVYVPADEVVAWISESKTSSGWKGFYVERGNGKVISEDAVERREDERYVYERQLRNYYYVDGELKVLIRSVEISYNKTPKRPLLVVLVKDATGGLKFIAVRGDTYHVRSQLKALGFKWDDINRWWYTATASPDQLIEKIKELGDVVYETPTS